MLGRFWALAVVALSAIGAPAPGEGASLRVDPHDDPRPLVSERYELPALRFVTYGSNGPRYHSPGTKARRRWKHRRRTSGRGGRSR